jgi:hypothetical protein
VQGRLPGLQLDADKTELLVTNENSLDPETLMRRPALTFTRGPIQLYSLGIDDMSDFNFDTSKKTKDVLVPGTMTINAVARNPLETEDLAWVVMEHIWLLRHLLMQAGFFEIGKQPPQMGSPSPAGSIIMGDKGDEFSVTSISVPFQFSRRSSYSPLGKQIVGSIQSALTLSDPPQVGSTGWPQSDNPNGPYQTVSHLPPPFAPDASDARGQTPDPAGTRQNFLPKQPHPLNPAKTVCVRTVRPNRPGVLSPNAAPSVPITDSCVEESSGT